MSPGLSIAHQTTLEFVAMKQKKLVFAALAFWEPHNIMLTMFSAWCTSLVNRAVLEFAAAKQNVCSCCLVAVEVVQHTSFLRLSLPRSYCLSLETAFFTVSFFCFVSFFLFRVNLYTCFFCIVLDGLWLAVCIFTVIVCFWLTSAIYWHQNMFRCVNNKFQTRQFSPSHHLFTTHQPLTQFHFLSLFIIYSLVDSSTNISHSLCADLHGRE